MPCFAVRMLFLHSPIRKESYREKHSLLCVMQKKKKINLIKGCDTQKTRLISWHLIFIQMHLALKRVVKDSYLLRVSRERFQKSLLKSSAVFSTKLFGKSLKCIALLFNPDSLKNISKEFTY